MSITKRRQRSLLDDHDVMEMILVRLPAFDIIRCKQVCKSWWSLISSPGFVSAHLERSKSDSPHLLLHNRFVTYLGDPLPGPFESFICFSSGYMLIVGSANGLICVAGRANNEGNMTTFRDQYPTPTPDDIWILNPVTGLSRKLPPTSKTRCAALTSTVKFAFWWEDDNSDNGRGVYKVAKIFSEIQVFSDRQGANTLEVWVSTSPDTWTDVATFYFHFYPSPHTWFHACDVLIEGLAAYWIVADSYKNISVVWLDFKTMRLKFNPLSKQQSNVPHKLICEPNSFLFGGNLNGEFVLIAHNFSCDGAYYDVWAMVMDDGWSKKFTFCLDSFPFDNCVGIVNEKLILKSCAGKVVASYDLVTGVLQVLESDTKLETIIADYAHGFVGSLVSIDGFGFESNDVLRKIIGVSWPYSYPSGRGGRRSANIYKEYSINISYSSEEEDSIYFNYSSDDSVE